ncbi:hypothetical protein BCR33DRAFT_495328 [Rhizoclosmatium globosum]|uniref:Uncharacterized protein n=1 Tax=Rhizoclosmatium globosum TaxID=329046 RepID=A0A1Y2CWS8_9FUNG|nr:hypothetical protein BCR33DRAFT_495328 [Rhizoclosmatium globosum]|eukprot:ORY50795.1 hypothetical protein BCR33DRAFT_495328 [Rhizoclosmatium globosum]
MDSREMRGMLSLCHSGADDDVFSANEYLWVSSIAQEDVNGFKWPVAKDSKTQKLSERDLGAQRVLLKRIEDIKYRWKILKMIVDDGRVDSRQDQPGLVL